LFFYTFSELLLYDAVVMPPHSPEVRCFTHTQQKSRSTRSTRARESARGHRGRRCTLLENAYSKEKGGQKKHKSRRLIGFVGLLGSKLI